MLDGEIFNADYVRPFTEMQLGTEGTLAFASTLFRHDATPTTLFDSLSLTVSDVRVQNIDTIVGPMNILDPVDWNTLANVVEFDGSQASSEDLTMTARIALEIGGDESPLWGLFRISSRNWKRLHQ